MGDAAGVATERNEGVEAAVPASSFSRGVCIGFLRVDKGRFIGRNWWMLEFLAGVS
jgi:hypothetical protein